VVTAVAAPAAEVAAAAVPVVVTAPAAMGWPRARI
jgi:hypothetical protein